MNALDKVKIARSFSRAASSYDSAAYFQRDMGLELLSMLPKTLNKGENNYCLDLGCGTGFFYQHLISQYKDINYVGVDIAEGMLNFFQQTLSESFSDVDVNADLSAEASNSRRLNDFLICTDAENISMKNETIDIIFSNMAVQWSENLPVLFTELNRILKPGGIIGLTTLGPQTLIELKQSWEKVDKHVHVNHFFPLERWADVIHQSGLKIQVKRVLHPKLQFDSVRQLLKELKLIGAHNVNKGQPQGLFGKKYLNAMYSAYEAFNVNGFFPASYEVYFFVIKKDE
jgi:malonyl-CoA O-methyltransferase